MTQQFPLLFTPFQLGKYTLQSRIVVTGHATNFTDAQKYPSEDYGYYLRERAKGGAGLVTMGGNSGMGSGGLVSLGGRSVHPTAGAAQQNRDDGIIPKFQRIAELVHEFPVPVIVQLGHPGRKAGPGQRLTLNGDQLSVAPSAVPTPSFGYVQVMPHEMSTDDAEEIVASFGHAARRVRSGGLDGVEVQVGGFGLISQFLHGQSNHRTDKYGGATLEERLTFLMEVLRGVRHALGPELLLGVRLYDDIVSYSIVYEDLKVIAQLLDSSGLLNYLSIWFGSQAGERSIRYHVPPYYQSPGEFSWRPEGIKELVSLPVIGVGRINTPALAEEMLANGKMDLVGMVRELIVDPHFPNKARAGRVEDIRTCIACNQSCTGRQGLGLPITCIYNPVTGHEKIWAGPGRAAVSKKVVVVGGGPAGMEAARVAAERGHQVVVFERSDRLGGQVKLAMLPPMRESYEEIILFGERQLPKLGVDVRLGEEADVETILAENPQAVVVATGSTPYLPAIPGVEGTNVLSLADVLNGAETGDRVVIVDTQGTPPGSLVADFLADQGKQVEIVTGLNYVGSGIIAKAVWDHLYGRLLEKGVTMSPMTGVTRIGQDSVDVYHVVNPEITRTIESVDTVVLAAGGQANDGLYRQLKGKIEGLYAVGDCAQPRDIEMATYEAHKVAVAI
jgi:2,4-dienoyl-CoA reductase-like NADH-dependent reductase (Old Yellow Enzyme family)/NADPH-dependent 2,4-dienoyl-CoA reductase/sulfur reductase-like enzyme